MNDISNVSIFGVETLVTTGFTTKAEAAQFDAFDAIVTEASTATDGVSLQLTASGTSTVLDLSDELAFAGGSRAVFLFGSADSENITTGAGADTINAGDGNDTVDAGAELVNDVINGEGGINTASYASATANVQIDLLFGFANGSNGSDTIINFQNAIGGAGNDVLSGTIGANQLEGGAGNDSITSDRQNDFAGGDDTLIGGDGDDTLIDMFGSATQVFGGTGSDRITLGFSPAFAGPSSGTIDGGEDAGGLDDDILILNRDVNLANFTLSGIESLFAGSNTVTGRAADFSGLSRIAINDLFPLNRVHLTLQATGVATRVNLGAALTAGGSLGADVFGSTDSEAITTGAGNDSIAAGDGADMLNGGAGNDTLVGNLGLDTYLFRSFGFGSDRIVGFQSSAASPNAHEVIDLGGLGLSFGDLTLSVSASDTTITFAGHPGDVIVVAGVTGLTIDDFNFVGVPGSNFIGDAFDNLADANASLLTGFIGGTLADLNDTLGDHFFANEGNDSVLAGVGNDIIEGGAGNDTLKGGAGDDTVDGGAGNDQLDGGTGLNTVTYATSAAAVIVNLAAGTVAVGADADTLTGFAKVIGSNSDDSLTGDGLANTLLGGTGNDSLSGGGGVDQLFGGSGNDVLSDLSGTSGNLDGGIGNDSLTVASGMTAALDGGDGNDVLVVQGGVLAMGGLTLTSVEELQTFGAQVTGTASQLDAFTLIRSDGTGANDGLSVNLKLTAMGGPVVLDLSDELSGGTALRGVTLQGNGDDETLTTGGGADNVTAGLGNDVVSTGAGNDTIAGGGGNDVLSGGADDDQLVGGAGDDSYFGGFGNDTITDDFQGAMAVSGDNGDDGVFVTRAGALTGSYSGGLGTDSLTLAQNSVVALSGLTMTSVETLNTNNGSVTARAAQWAQFGTIRVSAADLATTVNLTLEATGGATTLNLSGALSAGGGPRGVFLSTSLDNETITTGAGNDTVTDQLGGGNDVINTGAGSDRILVSKTTSLTLDAGTEDDLLAIGALTPTAGSLEGGLGQDTLMGGTSLTGFSSISGFEVLQTGLSVTYRGRAAQFDSFDTIRTGDAASTDVVFLALDATGATTTLDLSDELANGLAFRTVSVLGSSDSEVLTASGGNDVLVGNGGNDILNGSAGDDSLDGAANDDALNGGTGNDLLVGGDGSDVLKGGDNDDVLTDTLGQRTSMDGGIGDDQLVIGNSFTTAVLRGGDGFDVLTYQSSSNAVNLSSLTVATIEALGTGSGTVTAKASQFAGFTQISNTGRASSGTVNLALSAVGGATTLDLSAKVIGTSSVRLHGSTDAETITTGAGRDNVFSGAGNDVLSGLGGNDTLSGEGNDDLIFGGSGADLIFAGDGADTLIGGTENDELVDQVGAVVSISGDDGDDRIRIDGSGALIGTIAGGTGLNTLAISGNVDLTAATITGISMLEVGNSVTARAAQLASFSIIYKNLLALNQPLAINLAGSGAATTTLDLSAALNSGGGPRGVLLTLTTETETITTGEGNDSVTGGGFGDSITTNGGDDTVTLNVFGAVTVNTGSGNDTVILDPALNSAAVLEGGFGTDVLRTSGNLGGASLSGFEVLVAEGAGVTAAASQFNAFTTIQRSLSLPDDVVTLNLLARGAASTLNLATKLVVGTTAHGVNLTGSSDNETLTTGAAADTVDGGGGDDVLSAGDGNDTIIDRAGSTTNIDAGTGDDVIDISGSAFASGTIKGGVGLDTLKAGGANLAVTLGGMVLSSVEVLDTGSTAVQASAAQFEQFDTIFSSSAGGIARLTLVTSAGVGVPRILDLSSELFAGANVAAFIQGSVDSEAITTGIGNDSINGGGGNDSLFGSSNDDLLRGGDGNDQLFGGDQSDTLVGDLGVDELTGGTGSDTFWFRQPGLGGNADVVKDFVTLQDQILLSRADFGTFDQIGGVTTPATQWFRANAGAMAADADDRFLYNTTSGNLFFDADGTGGAAKVLVGSFSKIGGVAPTLSAFDFIVQDTVDLAI